MSYTRIRNPNVRANAVLPSPFTGAIEAGGSVVLPFSSAQILSACPSITRSFELTDLPAGSEGSSNDVATHGPLGYNGYTLEGDIDAGGGFRSGYSFAKTSIAAGDSATTASSTAVAMTFHGVATGVVLPRAGSIVGISLALTAAAAGSSIIVAAYKNGTLVSSSALTVAIDATSGYLNIDKDTLAFAAGDVLTVKLRTGSGWSATANGVATLFVEC